MRSLKHIISWLLVCIISTICYLSANAQIISGSYDDGLTLAFNAKTNRVTGYFAISTGFDESTGKSKFSCVFYLSGFYNNNGFAIKSYDPLDNKDNSIVGEIQIKDSITISIKLVQEPGGCWNVQHFSNGFVDFKLATKTNWFEISYINIDKAYFYRDRNEASKRKAYVVKGDIVYIDQIEDEWIHCKYYGKSATEGWIKKELINKY